MKCLMLWMAAALAAAQTPKITYTKSFPGSQPAFVAITLEKSGQAEYREAPDDENPLKFELTPAECGEIFALAEKLERFKRPLESNLKVANTGIKTFRYEHGSEKNEVKFNYSTDPDAKLLWDWFERMTETELHRVELERSAKWDKLGVNKAILMLEASHDRKRLVAPQQFLPVLDRIAKNSSYLHMARERAASLAAVFRGAASQPAAQ